MADASSLSIGTHPEISLGSFDDDPPQRTPAKVRVLSASSGTSVPSSAPLDTPSPPGFSRRATVTVADRPGYFGNADEDEGADYGVGTPVATRPKRSARPSAAASKGALTLRDQEKHIDNLKKENFNIKLRVHFLEERLAQLAPDQIDAALKQNISLKIEVQQRGMELKKLKKLVLELERELQRAGPKTRNHHRERELEDKLEERERELRELRRRAANDASDPLLAERNAELEEQLDNMRGLLEDNMDELERLRDIVERQNNQSEEDHVAALEATVAELRDQLSDRHNENEDLADSLEQLRLENAEIQQQLQRTEAHERSASRAMILEEREEREAVEDELNSARDKIAAVLIELQQKEDELELKTTEIDELVAEHDRVVAVVEDEWRGEVEEARNQVEELRDVLAERDAEAKDLRLNIAELEANTNDLHTKFEAALAHLEQEADDRDTEIEKLSLQVENKDAEIERYADQLDSKDAEIDRLGEQIFVLEDETDRLKEAVDDDGAEREGLEGLVAALKEKMTGLKTELADMTAAFEESNEVILGHRARQEELATHVEDLVSQLQVCKSTLDSTNREHANDLRELKRELDAKESALQSALDDLGRTQGLLSAHEADLAAVQTAMQSLEVDSRRAGETASTARFSLELELDRVRRDLERVEAELLRSRADLANKDARGRAGEETVDSLHAELLSLKAELSAQTQARLNVSERLDAVQLLLRTSEADSIGHKKRVAELEGRLSKEQRALLSTEGQYRDQLTERNTLLLTIYQYLDRILGVEKTPKKGSQAETKPFTNFGVFHDNLISRLKTLSGIQSQFDKRVKDAEGRFGEKLKEMNKQLDMRWKQIDKFEAGVKGYAEAKAGWRKKMSVKEGEVDALRATNVDLSNQLSRKQSSSDPMEVRSLSTRAANAERRLNNAQNQLLATEEKVALMTQRSATADSKWEARVKEYELRLKAAEERVKRERQGGKERVAELESNIKILQRQLDLALKRSHQLNEVVDAAQLPASGSANSLSSR
ncbi:unnamed protein product [Mycena citricolor]|uniref:Centrosomin N-terminal motif 1 domain-containing protein n=1 Tax=Mycena citricolor TaxID=2018698 RepID=A0AAD2JU88_9AGAR|nr:unnamed protein product [Mycena citricolor]